jgi:hypothetical protein
MKIKRLYCLPKLAYFGSEQWSMATLPSVAGNDGFAFR